MGFFTLLAPLLLDTYLGANELMGRGILVFFTSLYCLHIVLFYRSVIPRLRAGVVSAALVFLAGRPLVELIHGDLELTDVAIFGGTGTVALALWALQPKLEWFRIVAIFGAVLAGISTLMAVLTPRLAFMITELGNLQGEYKTSSQWGLLAGPFWNANTLGVILATAIPFVFLWRRISARILLLVPILGVLLMTVSRTSIVASVLVVLLLLFVFHRRSSVSFQKAVAFLALMITMAIQLILPFLSWSPSFFTGRGRVWAVDLAAWLRNPWLGNGESWHSDQSTLQVGVIQADHTSSHNMVLGWLTFGGLFYFLCCAGLLLLLTRASWKYLELGYATPVLFTIVLLVVGISESNWHMLVSSPSFFMHGFLMLGLLFAERNKSPREII